MQSIEALASQAKALANGHVVPMTESEQEVARIMQICNACRYCEGFCAVFPAMTRRLEFAKADVNFLSNLCHNCGACLTSCQYAPPHAFGVNVPRAMAEVRGETYSEYAWPAPLGKLYQRNGLTLSVALFIGLSVFLVLSTLLNGHGPGVLWGQVDLQNNFYNLFPHNLLVGMFAPIFLFALFALGMGVRRFWRDIKPATSGTNVSTPAALEATGNVLALKYLDGGHGEGCTNDDDAFTQARRYCHHLTFYGFLLCFAATSLGTIYHYFFGWAAPYEFPSLPKLLGAAGGISMMLGTAGLWRLNRKRNPEQGSRKQKPMDLGFIALLFFVASTGMALWLGRGTPALAVLLCVHLGAVMALFLTLPYNKFAHGLFRTAALLRHTTEKRQPNPIGLGDD